MLQAPGSPRTTPSRVIDYTQHPGTSIRNKDQGHTHSNITHKIPGLIIGNDSSCHNGFHHKMQATTPCRCGYDRTEILNKTTTHKGLLPTSFTLQNGQFSKFTFPLAYTVNKHRCKNGVRVEERNLNLNSMFYEKNNTR